MSSLGVRNAFRAEIQAYLTANHPTVRFFDTINFQRSPPSNELWVTADFSVDFAERMAIGCNDSAEYGMVDINVYGRAGVGDTNVLTLAQDLADHFRTVSLTNVTVEDVQPPADAIQGDARHWYAVYTTVEYVSFS